MKNIAITANKNKDKNSYYLNKTAEYLKQNFCNVFIDYNYDIKAFLNELKDVDLIVSLGGDGSLLHLAGNLIEKNLDIPILGINIGHMGFLTELEFDENLEKNLNKLKENNFSVEKRMMINGKVYRNNKIIAEYDALNDLVCFKGLEPHISEFQLSVNDKIVSSYTADGIIFATPTGSTAYSLSAGGPILEPNLEAITVTPICAHSLAAKAIVFNADNSIKLKIIEREDCSVYLQKDGKNELKLQNNDEIIISKSLKHIKLIKLDGSFYEIVNKKFN